MLDCQLSLGVFLINLKKAEAEPTTREVGMGYEDMALPGPDEVPRRLLQMGLTVEFLLDCVRRGQIASDFCTASHPVFYAGQRVYGETNGALREGLAVMGWEFQDDLNIPTVVSPDHSVAITAVSGNRFTGLEGDRASTRRPRRAAGVRIVRRNNQLELIFEGEAPTWSEAVQLSTPTWFLLYFRDGDVVRSELSLATGVSPDGGLLKWSERLVLPELDMLTPPPPRRDDDSPDLDVPVTRRVA